MSTDFFEVVRRQRACRSFSDVPVSDETLGRVLAAATFAPSAENRQPWEFVVVRDGVSRARIGDLTRRAWEGQGRAFSQTRLTPGLLADVERGAMGSYAIIGAHLPVAAGAAWSAQYRGTEQVAVCFFGDGTTNIGAFHEALNFAVVWKLPVVFVCEDNLYMEYTPIGSVTAVEHPAADRAGAYNLEKVVIDGNDADEVYLAAVKYMSRARKGGGPALIEAMTYRHSGHSRADPAKYRPEGELERWLQRDPVNLYRARLLEIGIAEGTLKDIEAEAMRKVDEATATAKASPVPALDAIERNVWANGGAAWRN